MSLFVVASRERGIKLGFSQEGDHVCSCHTWLPVEHFDDEARFTARKLTKYRRQSRDYKILSLVWCSLFLTGGSALLFLVVSDKSWDSLLALIAGSIIALIIILGASAPSWDIPPALDVDSSEPVTQTHTNPPG